MKKSIIIIVTVTAICGVFAGCCNKKETKPAVEAIETAAQPVESMPAYTYIDQASPLAAVYGYLTDSIGSRYAQGEVCIPCGHIVKMDEKDTNDIKVWGDFWIFNYDRAGDTLKTVSGGDHPGLMHVKKTGETYAVTAFDPVEDGSRNLPSAKRIFGKYYNDFHKYNSDEQSREKTRQEFLYDYVTRNKLPINYYQDYGWPAVKISK